MDFQMPMCSYFFGIRVLSPKDITLLDDKILMIFTLVAPIPYPFKYLGEKGINAGWFGQFCFCYQNAEEPAVRVAHASLYNIELQGKISPHCVRRNDTPK